MTKTVEELEARVKDLESALKPFAQAYERLRYYDETGTDVPDDACIYAEHDNCQNELFADGLEEQQLLAVGHLANAAQFFQE